MKITLSPSDIADRLLADPYAGWTYHAAQALAEYLDALDEENDTETELDCCEIRGIYAAYDSALDVIEDFYTDYENDLTLTPEEQEEEALKYLHNDRVVIEYDGGVIIEVDG